MDLDDNALFTPPEATTLLRIGSPRTLERWRSTGNGPAYVKVGRRVAYTGASLRAYVQQQTRTHTGEMPDLDARRDDARVKPSRTSR